MEELNKCLKCKSAPELIDGRTSFFARCNCPAGDNVIYGQSVSFLDHINIDDNDELSDRVSEIVFGLVPWDLLKSTTIDSWNSKNQRLIGDFELKSCPFCGSEAKRIVIGMTDGYPTIKCSKSFCEVYVSATTWELAEIKWNKRGRL